MSENKTPLDRADRQILSIVQSDARSTLAEISEQVHLSVSQTQRRLKRLQESGVIKGYFAHIDATAIGYEISAYAEVSLKNQDTNSAEQFHLAIEKIPEVIECHRVSGDADYLLRIVATGLQGYSKFAQTTIMAIEQVDRLRSLIVFESPKDTTVLPLK